MTVALLSRTPGGGLLIRLSVFLNRSECRGREVYDWPVVTRETQT